MNSAEKTARLLKLLAEEPYVHGITKLGKKISCGKSGTYKLLNSLVQEGLVTKTPDRQYTLGMAVFFLGKTYEENVGIAKFAKPYLVRLRDLTEENASFSIVSGGCPTLIWRENSKQLVQLVGDIGKSRSFYAGAISKVLSAYEDEAIIRKKFQEEPIVAYTENTITSLEALIQEFAKIREQGYALSDGEYNIETYGIAAPIYDNTGKVWAAVSLGIPKIRIDETKKERYILILKAIAKEITQELAKTLLPPPNAPHL